MSRHLEGITDHAAVNLLGQLADQRTDSQHYRSAMHGLGLLLGNQICRHAKANRPKVRVVCTVEDADFLARGVIELLSSCAEDIRVTCFWNTKVTPFENDDLEITPITRRYEEPASRVDWLVVVKSIISGACVVKTNLMEVIGQSKPQTIFIVAPVMHVELERKLRAEFSKEINRRFVFVVFARDDQRAKNGEITPGIGGEIYSRLGFKGRDDKNTYVPDLIKERRGLARTLAMDFALGNRSYDKLDT